MQSLAPSHARRRSLLRSRRLIGLAAVGLIVLSSCGTGDDGDRRGVGVRSINTNIGLGIELEAVAPANIVVESPRRAPVSGPSQTIPPFDFDIPPRTTRPCPAAGPFDFPAVETGVDPAGRPAEGRYDWKLDGTVTTGNGVLEVDAFETRTIASVQDHPSIPNAFTFEVTQENLIDERQTRGELTTRFRVVPQSPVHREQLPSDAGRGLFIEQMRFQGQDRDEKEVESVFTPSPPVQLLAFPVQDGAAINSSGTDPETFARLTVQGQVKGKKQVDACGDRVDTWFVDAEQTYQYPAGGGQTEELAANYDYGVAIQYGGLVVFEHVDAPQDGPAVEIEARIGEVPRRTGA